MTVPDRSGPLFPALSGTGLRKQHPLFRVLAFVSVPYKLAEETEKGKMGACLFIDANGSTVRARTCEEQFGRDRMIV